MSARQHYDREMCKRVLLQSVTANAGEAPTIAIRDALAAHLQRESDAITGLFYSVLGDLLAEGELVRVPHGRQVFLMLPGHDERTIRASSSTDHRRKGYQLHAVPQVASDPSPSGSTREAMADLSHAFRTLAKACEAMGEVADQVRRTSEEGLDMSWRESIDFWCQSVLDRLDRMEHLLRQEKQ